MYMYTHIPIILKNPVPKNLCWIVWKASQRQRSSDSLRQPLWESRIPISRPDFPLWCRRPSVWCLGCPAWSVQRSGPKGPAATRAIPTSDTWHPCQGVGHCWIDRIDGLLHKSLGQLHHFGTLIWGYETVQPAQGMSFLLHNRKEFENIRENRFCAGLALRFWEGCCPPNLSLLSGVSGIQSSSQNDHFWKIAAFLSSAACAILPQFCHKKVHRGVGNLENLDCN